MRFNAKEIAAVASQPSYKFDREGLLLIKERQEGLFRRNDLYTERWCRLRGNLFFYFKGKDQCSDPFGLIVLEHCTVKSGPDQGNLCPFSFVFHDSEEWVLQAACYCAQERESWVVALRDASFSSVRSQVQLLRTRLSAHQRESDPGLARRRCATPRVNDAEACALKKDPTRFEPLLELSLACDNLRCDADGQPPNPVIVVMVGRALQALWSKFAQTEVVQRCSNPCFLTTVGFLKHQVSPKVRIKLCVYDVREQVTATRTMLGEATFTLGSLLQTKSNFLRLTLLSPSCEGVGFVTVAARELQPEICDVDATRYQIQEHTWPMGERQRSYSLPVPLSASAPCRATTPLHAQLRVAFENLSSQTYRFHTGLGAELRVHEIMAETRLSFSFPQLLLNLWINEEKQLMETVTLLGELTEEWHARQLGAMERHLQRINCYAEALDALATYHGPQFKPSKHKGNRNLEFVPVNLHLQRLWVQNTTSRRTSVYDVITVGAFTAYPHKYQQGGLQRLFSQLKNINATTLNKELSGCALGPDRLSSAAQSLLTLEQLKDDLEGDVRSLLKLADLQDSASMLVLLDCINSKAKQLTNACNPSLVEEALTVWESAKRSLNRSTPAAPQQNTRQYDETLDLSLRNVRRAKSASLPREFAMPAFPAESASPSDEDAPSDDEESSRSDRSSTDAAGGIIDFHPMKSQLRKSESTYSADDPKFLCLSEEFEPLDLTHLNIRASIMCMGSKVQHLATGSSASLSPEEDPGTPCTPLGELSPWAAELMPSIRKLRQAAGCLQRVARLTYALHSLKEPPQAAALSYAVRYRRDVCFSHALTALVSALMAKLWCQQPDPIWVHALSTCGALALFVGLLSCHGDEMHMLEDMVAAIEDLRRVLFWLEPSTNVSSPKPRVEGNRVFLSVMIPASEAVMNLLPHKGASGFRFTVTPVYLNVGINEQATLAEKFGDQSFQERINLDGTAILKDYHRRLQKCPYPKGTNGSRPRGFSSQEVPVANLIDQLQNQVHSRKSKNVEILHLATEACRRMHGLRFTSCKSAKDRTAMSVTLEQAQVLVQEFGLDPKEVPKAVACMRSEGTRRHNTYKNVGVRKYAFNSLQLVTFPRQYRPPPGTFGNVQS
ncbi:inositol polyphosphate-4-phosphatase type I A-like [Ornithodoros turicata]|uniref:inositol polyphosphate-4-phosphatase type I A-like n=1 Tax=Ornithodoros turicata TaxID=34597 RepID=UPI00313A1352